MVHNGWFKHNDVFSFDVLLSPLINHPLGLYILMAYDSNSSSMEGLGQITGLLCVRLARATQLRGPSRGEHGSALGGDPTLRDVAGRSPLGVGTRGGQMPGGGGSTRKAWTLVSSEVGRGRLLSLVGKVGDSQSRP